VALRNARFRNDWGPLEPGCQCYTCRNHSGAYLHHLTHMKEMTSGSLLSLHNIFFLHQEAKACRQAILDGRFKEYFEEKSAFLKGQK
ncbi:MAG: queuine tRNA-ribosyltransferase family protein, partial [Candidatus Obscuribacterales bacterium]|nr:queuine tRNA-ribosyltransferase family protein [Candidatus Obscuribacterales bacterium]